MGRRVAGWRWRRGWQGSGEVELRGGGAQGEPAGRRGRWGRGGAEGDGGAGVVGAAGRRGSGTVGRRRGGAPGRRDGGATGHRRVWGGGVVGSTRLSDPDPSVPPSVKQPATPSNASEHFVDSAFPSPPPPPAPCVSSQTVRRLSEEVQIKSQQNIDEEEKDPLSPGEP
nr:protein FAM98B-like [Aegilops tauschii subsp. strangulata]